MSDRERTLDWAYNLATDHGHSGRNRSEKTILSGAGRFDREKVGLIVRVEIGVRQAGTVSTTVQYLSARSPDCTVDLGETFG